MKLKAPLVVVAGAALAGAGPKESPVQVEQVDGGFAVSFSSGLVVTARDTGTAAIWNDRDKSPVRDDEGGGGAALAALDADGLKATVLSAFSPEGMEKSYEWRFAGRDDGDVELSSSTCAAPLLSTVGDAVRVSDCAGGEVEITATRLIAKVDGVEQLALDGAFFVDDPAALAVLASSFKFQGVRVARIDVEGASHGGRLADVQVDEAAFTGAHYGVTIGAGTIRRLVAAGALTGAALSDAVILEYDGPASFQPGTPFEKKP